MPTTLTYETTLTPSFLDPAVLYDSFGVFTGNIYENLFWFNGTSTSELIPWLAQNYTESANLKSYNVTLRSGISFQDGEPLNSTAVYFSLDRMLVMDASSPTSHGSQFAPDFQQLLNHSLSTALCGCTQTYNATFVNAVLGENFIQVTGPLTFTINVETPSSFLLYILAAYNFGMILAPNFVMQHDLALWNQSSNGYTLPYPTLSGNETNQIYEYLLDEAATCNAGSTPQGCGTTYLDGSYQGSEAGTGPYSLQSYDQSTNDLTFVANPNYWGGAYQFLGGEKIIPHFTTVKMDFVPSVTTREVDLQNAAHAGQAMIVDIPSTNLYDVASRSAWLDNNTLDSVIPGVTINGPFSEVGGVGLAFDLNVTNPATGTYYTFQPTADLRFREAMADSVNLSSINSNVNNNLGQVSNGVIPPTAPPTGAYNSSLVPPYGFNPDEVATLLLSAMENPVTHFTFENGSVAPAGEFNNTFGCPTLNSAGVCTNPVAQTLVLNYASGDTVNEAIETQIATVMNNVSATYNMGLTVSIEPVPIGYMYSNTAREYVYNFGWSVDYPWVTWILSVIMTPGLGLPSSDGWYGTTFTNLYHQAIAADSSGNTTGLVAVANQMSVLEDNTLIYLPTFYSEFITVTTSVVQGYYWNPALNPTLYFDTLY